MASPLADPAPPPAIESRMEHTGLVIGRTGAFMALSGAGAATTGLLLMATTRCEDCFEPPAQWWTGLAFISGGVLAEVAAVPLVVTGPVVRHAGMKRRGVAVSGVAGWTGVAMAGAAVASFAGAIAYPREPAPFLVAGTALAVGSEVAAGVQAQANADASRVAVVPTPGGLAIAGRF